MGKFRLPHSSHNMHLCYLVNLGIQDRDPDEYQKLIREPKFMCKKCGRVSSKPRNLCKPVKI
ncbi:MAG: hypothetical protein WC374_09400 [Phycisphaerae bacterium]|jgi:hypothetical protein